jgi:hypothetical protein
MCVLDDVVVVKGAKEKEGADIEVPIGMNNWNERFVVAQSGPMR